MRIESKLCHVSENKVIVQVTGWVNDQIRGSALAEGRTVEDAEDKAILRLNKRINIVMNNETIKHSSNKDNLKPKLKIELPKSEKKNINDEPSDWSSELTAIDSEIERLKWSREDEIKFLEANFGHTNRNKITNYNEIIKYLNTLKSIDKPSKNSSINRSINTLIEESNIILNDLSWDHIQGRDYLKKEFNVSSRNELNEEQLISFVNKLKLMRNQI